MITAEMIAHALADQSDPNLPPTSDAAIKELDDLGLKHCRIHGSFNLKKMAEFINHQVFIKDYNMKR